MRILIALSALLLIAAAPPPGPPDLEGVVDRVYKQTPQRPVHLYILSPARPSSQPAPAIVFFFGGGWVGGSPNQFTEQARHFADRGFVCILTDYRVKSRDDSTPFDSVRDARSALRWVRRHATELRIDPAKIVASGGSAGGHVAGATAVLDSVNDPSDDLTVSPVPAALVLFNPVLDTTETGYGAKLIGKDAIDLSLTHHVRAGLPPTILFHGTSDHTVPFANAVEFKKRMQQAGNECELVPFEGADHGFFNSPKFRKGASIETYRKIIDDVDRFLARHHLN